MKKKETIETKIVEVVPVNPKLICDRCKAIMIITGGGRSGTDLKCLKCGNQTTKMI